MALHAQEIGLSFDRAGENDVHWREEHLLAESFGLWVITNMYYEVTEGRILTETMPYMAGGMLSDDEHSQRYAWADACRVACAPTT